MDDLKLELRSTSNTILPMNDGDAIIWSLLFPYLIYNRTRRVMSATPYPKF